MREIDLRINDCRAIATDRAEIGKFYFIFHLFIFQFAFVDTLRHSVREITAILDPNSKLALSKEALDKWFTWFLLCMNNVFLF